MSSASYDLVDLYFEMGERLPGELAVIALEQLEKEPHRLDGRCSDLVARVVESWKVRFPVSGEVEQIVTLLKPRTKRGIGNLAREDFDKLTPEDIPLVHLVSSFTQQTRASPDFSAKFRIFNRTLMPHVISVFELKTS